jgi:hypothetical protein
MRTSLIVLAIALAMPAAFAQKAEREAATAAGELSEVGKGKHLARQPLRPGAYINAKHRQAALAWMAKHPAPASAPGAWKIGEALDRGAKTQPVPAGLQATLPKAPPGNRYVLLGADVLLIASSSRIVVDAVEAGAGS